MARNVNPVPGSIKSIQRGVINSSGGSATATVTAVNTSKAVLSFLGQRLTADDVRYHHELALTNSTTITAARNDTSANNAYVSWQLVEYH